jgi:hypothetical protein
MQEGDVANQAAERPHPHAYLVQFVTQSLGAAILGGQLPFQVGTPLLALLELLLQHGLKRGACR